MEASIIQQYSDKSIASLIKLATKYFNAYIRRRDSEDGYFDCASCGHTKSTSQLNAGHFYSAGSFPELRFNEDNVHGQCIYCNLHLHGNLDNYRKGLKRKIGADRLNRLDDIVGMAKVTGFKWDRYSLINIIEKYKNL